MMQLVCPTVSLIKEYACHFADEPNTGQFALALQKLVAKFPRNDDLSDVCLKVAAINSMYATKINAVFVVAQHIHNLKIDDRLKRGERTLVDDIARVQIGEKVRINYSFSSKYCSWHNPDAFAKYDSYVDYLLWNYQLQDKFIRNDFKQSEMWGNYPRFMEILLTFREYFHLAEITLQELDDFLWLYGQKVYNAVHP